MLSDLLHLVIYTILLHLIHLIISIVLLCIYIMNHRYMTDEGVPVALRI